MEIDRNQTGETSFRLNELNYSDEPGGLPWPASKLSFRDLHRLGLIRYATKKPLTLLLKEAVQLLWDATQEERDAVEKRVEVFLTEHRAKVEQTLKDRENRSRPHRTIALPASGFVQGHFELVQFERPSLETVAEASQKPRTNNDTGFDS